jgi:tetratricopeptide (TPR) repeat protein
MMIDKLRGLLWAFLLLLCSACANVQLAGDVQSGRMFLLMEEPNRALSNFRAAAAQDPNYYVNWSLLQEGVWTYVGRCYYTLGNLPAARQALERAVTTRPSDNMAKLYLGLVLLSSNDTARGLKETDAGLKGLYDWLNYVTLNVRPDGQFWDPGGAIRKQISDARALIQGPNTNVPQLISAGQAIGNRMEREMDLARQQQLQMLTEPGGGAP